MVKMRIRLSVGTSERQSVSPRERDEETGQFSQEYTRWEFLAAIEGQDTPTTTAIAEYVDCSYDLAYRRLHDLENDGVVTKDEIGGVFLWKRTGGCCF